MYRKGLFIRTLHAARTDIIEERKHRGGGGLVISPHTMLGMAPGLPIWKDEISLSVYCCRIVRPLFISNKPITHSSFKESRITLYTQFYIRVSFACNCAGFQRSWFRHFSAQFSSAPICTNVSRYTAILFLFSKNIFFPKANFIYFF